MLKWIFGELDGTLIVTPKGGRMLLLESKLWKDLLKPQGLLNYINYFSILCFYWRKRKILLFLTIPIDRSDTKIGNITCSRFMNIKVTIPIRISETNQQRSPPCTVIYPKQNCTPDIPKYPFISFSMALMGCFHIPRNKINKKGNVMIGMSRISKAPTDWWYKVASTSGVV